GCAARPLPFDDLALLGYRADDRTGTVHRLTHHRPDLALGRDRALRARRRAVGGHGRTVYLCRDAPAAREERPMTIDLFAYLNRVGYTDTDPVKPTAAMLSNLHWSHLLNVPFENLDIRPLHRQISLDLAAIEDKVVARRRGGFCYELNGLLAAALTQ